jgi:hypothetical protein
MTIEAFAPPEPESPRCPETGDICVRDCLVGCFERWSHRERHQEQTTRLIGKTEELVRTSATLGHRCSLRRWYDPARRMTYIQCDDVRQPVTDQALFVAEDPEYVVALATYRVVRDAHPEPEPRDV